MADQITTPSGLKYEDIEAGTGAAAQSGQKAKVHYTGWLKNGQKFDSSKDRNDRSSSRSAPDRSSKDGTRGSPA